MANHRIEEVFVANQVFGNGNVLGTSYNNANPITHINNINALNGLSQSVVHNVVGLLNADTNFLILNSGHLNNARKVRFISTSRTRPFRQSDIIDRDKIVSITNNSWRHYHPVVYRIDLSGGTVNPGSYITLGIKLKQEPDFEYKLLQFQYKFTSNTVTGQDIVNIVNGINELISKITKNFVPLKVFTGNNTGSTIDFNAPSTGNNFIYFIAGQNTLDKQNIRQLEIYDFDVIQMESYNNNTKTYTNNWLQLFPSSTKERGTIGLPAGYQEVEQKPISYDSIGQPISKLAGAFFHIDTNPSPIAPKPSESNGFYEDIISHIHQTDLGQVLGHNNRIIFQDNPELPRIIITPSTYSIVGANIPLTDRYSSYHIEYIDHAIDNGLQNQLSTKTKRFTLYYNAIFDISGAGNVEGNANYPLINFNQSSHGFIAFLQNLKL